MEKETRKKSKVRFAFLFMMAFLCMFNYSPINSFACSCMQPDTAQAELDRSAAVFSGKVVDMVDVNKNNSIQSSADPIAVLFEVKETWKGLDQTQVIIYTERDSASCGYEFTLDQQYLVYANETDGELRTGLCSRTTPLLTADMDLDELGIGEKPTEQVSINLNDLKGEEQPSSDNSANNILYIILLVVGLLLVVIYIARTNKKNE
ncbi:hypothetical protein MHB48_12260 [Psychrobacillus sp. FSL H8-0483]|uniref:hypothetical protein n=1 Tax=Psychrobacillus sp. FSL H8-0483 TaxID=2921389 RepID=UPI00315A3844